MDALERRLSRISVERQRGSEPCLTPVGGELADAWNGFPLVLADGTT